MQEQKFNVMNSGTCSHLHDTNKIKGLMFFFFLMCPRLRIPPLKQELTSLQYQTLQIKSEQQGK